MNKINKLIIGSSLLLSSTLFAQNNIDLQLNNIEEKPAVEKVKKILNSVREEGLTKNLQINSLKWEEVNSMVTKLIERENYKNAYILFKHINLDQNLEEYTSHLRFFQIINKMNSKHTDFNNIVEIHNNFLLNHIFMHFFKSIEEEKINDTLILSKIDNVLLEIDNKYFSLLEKQRVRYKLNILRGQYIKALSILETIEEKNEEDRKYFINIKKVLYFMQESFFKNKLNITHNDFTNYNILYRTNPTKCDK